MKIIGLTGGIGSGKSTVLNFFKELGAETFIADVEAKKLMVSNVELVQQITDLFGKKAYLNNQLNREFIASIVFKDKTKLKALNELVHPKVRESFNNFVKKSSSELIIYEAAILFESGSDAICDYIITVTASVNDKINRIVKRDNVSKEQIKARMENQLNDEIKIRKSDFVVINSELKSTKVQVNTIFELLLKVS